MAVSPDLTGWDGGVQMSRRGHECTKTLKQSWGNKSREKDGLLELQSGVSRVGH